MGSGRSLLPSSSGIRDYLEVLGDAPTQALLRGLRAMRSLLYVGCGEGISDPNFESLLKWARTAFLQSEYRHFRLASDGEVQKFEAQHQEGDRIYVLSYGQTHAALEPYLVRLAPEPPKVEDPRPSAKTKRLGANRRKGPQEPNHKNLSRHYFAIQRQIIDDNAPRFSGRTWAVQALERFLDTNPRGYFLLRGVRGQGKTSFAAYIVKTRDYPHHFVSRDGGRSDARLILRSLLAQLLIRLGQSFMLPESVPELTKALEEAMGQLAKRQGRLVIVIDALDQLPEVEGADWAVFLTEALPKGTFMVVTVRSDNRLEPSSVFPPGIPSAQCELGPLDFAEIERLLRARRPMITLADIARVAAVTQRNPLYLNAILDELAADPGLDLLKLPPSIEGFYRRAMVNRSGHRDPLLIQVLGLLDAARTPLSLLDLCQITEAPQEDVYELGLRPILPFLNCFNERYEFYHDAFREFVERFLQLEQAPREPHRRLAAWLDRPDQLESDYRRRFLAHHLYHAGDIDHLIRSVDHRFLAEKVRNQGYAVLEDLELLTKAMLDGDDPDLVEHCVSIVEGLRQISGEDVIEETQMAVRGFRPSHRSEGPGIETPSIPATPRFDVFVGMIPKMAVGADFCEVVPLRGGLTVAIGDAPGRGLKSAFIARFIANLFRRRVLEDPAGKLGSLFDAVTRTIASHPFFETVSMQAASFDPARALVSIVNAGLPRPLHFSAVTGRCESLPVRGIIMFAGGESGPAIHYEASLFEFEPGDIFVFLTDGLIDRAGTGAATTYGLAQLLQIAAPRGARAVGTAILEEWHAKHRGDGDADDVTVMVVATSRAIGADSRRRNEG